ncbi:hypothetical protein U1701_07510 [Sphingomonas sp. PB2P19]|uniref:hypothetical protein n=1 Tax=Sphingomonas rhamnosi TaxID=3096156 RepID=UPI002FC7754E
MRKHDRIIVELSMQILREAVDRSRAETVATVDVRLALRCLLPYCRERWSFISFWHGAARPDNSRFANLHPCFNGIWRQLKDASAYDGPAF